MTSELVAGLLRREGLNGEIDRVDTLADFASRLGSGSHSLVLSDFSIPGMNALEALRLAHERRPDLPYVFFSGTLGEEAAIEALKQGATDYVLKDRPGRRAPAVRRALREREERSRQAEAEHAGREAIRQSDEKYRAVFEQAAIGMGRVNFTDARWIDVNDAFCRMLGYSCEEICAIPWPQMTHPEDVELDLLPFQRMAKGELERYTVEKRFIHKHGHAVWARLTLSLVRDRQGRPDYEVAIIEDITERKQTEAALQRARQELALANQDLDRKVRERTAKLRETIAELEGFSYSLIHDMRAPLRAIHTYASVLEEDWGARLQPESLDHLRRIKGAAHRMDQLITDALNYSKLVRAELPLRSIDLGQLLLGIIETYPNLQAPGAEIRIEIEDLSVVGNEAALIQVFSNLLGNGVKFVAPGIKPKVRVWAEEIAAGPANPQAQEAERSGPGSVLIWVEDNGIGIPKEGQNKIFGMFQRMHRVEEYPGTGIGLAIVRKALERIGGQVCLDSEPGKGSRFCVKLERATESKERKKLP